MLSTNKTKLVRLAAALALLGTASFGAMAEWKRVGESSNFTTYVDLSTIRRSGNMAKMWTLYDMNAPTASPSGAIFLSMRSRDEYDCSDERRRGLDMSTHTERMGGGSTVDMSSAARQWASIPPGSIIETFFKVACGVN